MVILFLVPAFFAWLLAKTWFLAAIPILWGLRLVVKHPGEVAWKHPLVQLGLAWLLVAAPTIWPGRVLAPHPWFPRLPAYTCLDMVIIALGFLAFVLSFFRAWGHRPHRR